VHTPAGFDRFVTDAGTVATTLDAPPPGDVPPDAATLARIAATHGIEILGPPPLP